MASKKKTTKHEASDEDHVTVTATHEIRTDEFGNLLSCIEIESGDEVPVPSDLRYLCN
jgi:hypothetical protein